MEGITPMMRQYLEIKEKNPGVILFFRLGDFYEMFFEDALLASRILSITLTSREAGKGNKVPMCGIPFHAANSYIARLVKSGKSVAICEQMEEPGAANTIVKREIIKIITPGTFLADEALEGAINNYILSVYFEDEKFGIAYSDLSTGELKVTEIVHMEDLFSELYKISPKESIFSKNSAATKCLKDIKTVSLGAVTFLDDWMFDPGFAEKEIKDHFKVKDLSGFGCQDMHLALRAAGALLKYLKNTQKNDLDNIDGISTYSVNQFMTLDWNSHRNLELIHSMENMSEKGTLFEVVDDTKTPMGKRLLKSWIQNPLVKVDAINERLEAVKYFFDNNMKRKLVKDFLDKVYDIDRLANKVSMGSANARDLLALASSLQNIGELKRNFSGEELPLMLEKNFYNIEDFSREVDDINRCIAENPPVTIKEGGIIREGYDKEVDELRNMIYHGKDWIVSLQKQEIERTGISSLKIGYNKNFGYYIEITNAKLDSVPENYIRKQTLVNAERFVTEELKNYESKIIGAEEHIKSLEYEIFSKLRLKISARTSAMRKAAESAAELDVISNFSDVAVKNNYVRPVVSDSSLLEIVNGRHPVLEKLLKDKEFVPNDIFMGPENGNIFIITGSNMAGKSTYIRQVALITIMAQIGSFVPADSAQIGVVDKVFTRVGASDRLYRGMSTFMVEMLETANILNNATEKSLIILDEIGRGTSTYDGVSIAWAVIEYITEELKGAKTLFATHFHEVTELADTLKGVRNYNLAVKEWGEDIVFLYKVVEGTGDESFGIHVAKLAGMPKSVIARSREILGNLQADSLRGNIRSKFSRKRNAEKEKQLELFAPGLNDHVVAKLKKLDTDNLTPIEALKVIVALRSEIK
ncbi:MAG: DNA mismatch repair protein MutS [Candidatus Omnitrophica bacterium]|nr:DNA mismatch repair protein MutS [Candidatus Omnitrophota bacterium]